VVSQKQHHEVTDALLYLAAIIGVGAAAFIVARSPTFWLGMGAAILKAAWPYLLKAVKPKDYTKEQLDKIARGEEPGAAGQNTHNNDGMHHK
jgi:hypothetical protein